MTAFSGLASLLLPPLAYLISGPVIGLITLRKGAAAGLQTWIAALLVLQLFAWLAGLPPQLGLMYALTIWLPVWAAATVLRLSGRQGLLLTAIVAAASLFVVAAYITVGDVAAFWQQWLDLMLEKAMPPENTAQYKAALQPVMMLLNAMMAAAVTLNVFISVLLARWWQARLFNQGAFQREFHALQLPALVLPLSTLVFVLMFITGEPWQALFRDITVLLILMYLLKGIAAVHRYVTRLKLSAGWLVTMYCLLMLLPQSGLLLACLGMTDTYMIWRRGKTGAA